MFWPGWQRLLHAALATSVVVALITHEGGTVHTVCGYLALALAALRVLLGFAGPAVARFAGFVRGPRATWAYACDLLRGREARYRNHNPLGGWMVVVLLACALTAAGSGALYVTDEFWGIGWVIALHAATSWSFLPLVALHVAGVGYSSWRHRENLAAAMVHGRKRADGEAG